MLRMVISLIAATVSYVVFTLLFNKPMSYESILLKAIIIYLTWKELDE